MTEVILPGLSGRLKPTDETKKDDPERDGRSAGLHRGTLSKDRVWKINLSALQLMELADFFGVTTDYLLGRD